MDRKEEYKIENLTMLQIQYLIELNKLEKKKGAVRMIAAKCGVNHSQVSRFFKKCIEEEELTESLDFTENGKRKLDWRCKMIRDVRDYLERSGITEGTEEVLKGQNPKAERIVIGDDGSVWYTNDHYYSFTKIE